MRALATTYDETAAIDRVKFIIDLFGGASDVATVLGKSESRVYCWTYPTSRGHGTGGVIPAPDQWCLLAEAQKRGLPLTAAHFFPEPASPVEAAE